MKNTIINLISHRKKLVINLILEENMKKCEKNWSLVGKIIYHSMIMHLRQLQVHGEKPF